MRERGRPRSFDRAAALQRAMEVFWAKGYQGASLFDLTSAMGINSPSLYAAFGSKEALFLEATDLYTKTEGPDIWNALEAPTAREAIEGFLLATVDAYSQPGKPQGCLIILDALHAGDVSETICRDLRERRAESVKALRKRLERGIVGGELPPSLDCEAVATFYTAVQQGMSVQARDGASRETLGAIANGAIAAWETLTGSARETRL